MVRSQVLETRSASTLSAPIRYYLHLPRYLLGLRRAGHSHGCPASAEVMHHLTKPNAPNLANHGAVLARFGGLTQEGLAKENGLRSHSEAISGYYW